MVMMVKMVMMVAVANTANDDGGNGGRRVGGTDYDGTIIGDGSAWLPGLVKPIYRWIPSIAVSDIFFYEGDEFSEWQGDILLSRLKFQQLLKLDYDDGKVRDVSIIFERKGRLRDVEVNNRGEIFYIVDDSKGSLWQLQKL